MSMNKHLFSVLILSATASAVCGQTNSTVPKLVVGITIDKLRSDYMDAFVADLVIIDDTQIKTNQYIALSKECLCFTDEYCALLGDIGGH